MGIVSHGLTMTIIEVRPCKKFKGSWCGASVCSARREAESNRLCVWTLRRPRGRSACFGDDDATIERNIVIDGRGQYPQVGCDYDDQQRGAKVLG
jgi:hypothetical protein